VGIARRSKLDGSFKREPVAVPVQLSWVPAERASERELIVDQATCDFGYLDMRQLFKLATMNTPNNFNGQMYQDDAMRVQVRVSAQNMRPRKPIVIEVFWDGQFVLYFHQFGLKITPDSGLGSCMYCPDHMLGFALRPRTTPAVNRSGCRMSPLLL
jgi:hypothetical protein